MLASDFDYALPAELIAQSPPARRGDSRMLVLDIASGSASLHRFEELPAFLRQGDCMAFNNTKVIKARLFASRPSGAKTEILLLSPSASGLPGEWIALMKPGKRVKTGAPLELLDKDGIPSGLSLDVLSRTPDGEFSLRIEPSLLEEVLERCGHIPLPPYIKRSDEAADSSRYQTVFASAPGAVAAPTAGLHFTPESLERVKALGVFSAELTLHVGQGTFKPVSVENVEDHKMHSEDFVLPAQAADTLNSARRSGGRILAVGTTSLRVLETCVGADRLFASRAGSTDIFIHPPCRPRSAEMLLTNFHLPKSTLLMLVCAFAGSRENVMKAYELAIRERMRFFSYGDCMLLK